MSALRMTPTMLHSIDRHGRITEVSDLWLSTLGYTWEEVIGRPSIDFLSEASARYAQEVVLPQFWQTGECEVEYEMRRKDGTLVPVRLRGVAVRSETGVRSIAVIEDLTERRALEQKMTAAQKLESLGFMAGNIAHDFNNLLGSVVGNAQIAMRHARHVQPAAGALDNILVAASRAAELCRQLLAYSGRGRFQIEDVEVDTVVREMVEVLHVNVGPGVRIELALAGEHALVQVDATQLRQVVMNLVINAGEAIADGGTITIGTAVVDLDAATIAKTTHPDVPPGRYFELAVADTGGGMSPDAQAHIFDPFYSTKATGRGLGLAAVHGIVRCHHGTIQLTSDVTRGTTFRVYLPDPTTRAARAATPVPRSRGTVVIVEDDELLRTTLGHQLADAGFDARYATGVDDLLELARTTAIGAFLIDLTMPHVSGAELATRLRAEHPDAYVVLMSGYATSEVPALRGARFLRKPFTEDELLRAIEHAR